MLGKRTGIVLRTSSAYKVAVTLLDEELGKIEGLIVGKNQAQRLFHGAVISYTATKSHSKYRLTDTGVLAMPTDWVQGEDFLFFHHVLELADYFLPWEQQATALYQLLQLLYVRAEGIKTKQAQKLYLVHFFSYLGIYPEEGLKALEKNDLGVWLSACINEHPQAAALQTKSFLRTMELHEESVT